VRTTDQRTPPLIMGSDRLPSCTQPNCHVHFAISPCRSRAIASCEGEQHGLFVNVAARGAIAISGLSDQRRPGGRTKEHGTISASSRLTRDRPAIIIRLSVALPSQNDPHDFQKTLKIVSDDRSYLVDAVVMAPTGFTHLAFSERA
jgi:hypothetical protein